MARRDRRDPQPFEQICEDLCHARHLGLVLGYFEGRSLHDVLVGDVNRDCDGFQGAIELQGLDWASNRVVIR